MKGKVLIVDDEQTALKVLTAILEDAGHAVVQAQGVDQAVQLLESQAVDTIISDIKMPGKTGLTLFNHVKTHFPEIPLIFLTAYGTIEAAVDAMKNGAYYYFIKPPNFQELKKVLAAAIEEGRLKREINQLRNQHKLEGIPSSLLGNTPEMKRIYDTIQTVKNTSSSVLICGETGTGKELIARALHYSGSRSYRPFVAVNCAAIPRELIEAELFGHERGAFTGASQRRTGRIEAAAGGTLFLDEIGEMDASVQSKLLRVLQEKEFSRLGDNVSIEVDFRLITSTNRDLREEVKKGNFREDLFYRLHVVCIHVPPLRERRNDIKKLAKAFIDEFCAREGKIVTLKHDTIKALEAYPWPGNVRELKNVIENLVVMAKTSKADVADLPKEVLEESFHGFSNSEVETLKQVEEKQIRETLNYCRGNKAKTARILGVSRKTLYKKIENMCSDDPH